MFTSDPPVPLLPIDGIGVSSTHADGEPQPITDPKSSKKSSPKRLSVPLEDQLDHTLHTHAQGKVVFHQLDPVHEDHPFDGSFQAPGSVLHEAPFEPELEIGNNGAIGLPAIILATDFAAPFFTPL